MNKFDILHDLVNKKKIKMLCVILSIGFFVLINFGTKHPQSIAQDQPRDYKKKIKQPNSQSQKLQSQLNNKDESKLSPEARDVVIALRKFRVKLEFGLNLKDAKKELMEVAVAYEMFKISPKYKNAHPICKYLETAISAYKDAIEVANLNKLAGIASDGIPTGGSFVHAPYGQYLQKTYPELSKLAQKEKRYSGGDRPLDSDVIYNGLMDLAEYSSKKVFELADQQ